MKGKSGKGEVLDRHDVMRRAMAEATSSDAFGGMTNDSHAEPTSSNAAASSHLPPSGSNGSVIDHGEKIGAGSLSFDHFAAVTGDGEVVHADGAPAGAGATPMTGSTSQDGKSSNGFPNRPKMGSRNNSFQSDNGIPEVAGYTASPAQSLFNESQPSTAPLSANSAQSSPAGIKSASHGRYATTGHTNDGPHSKQGSLAVPNSGGTQEGANGSKHMHESASTSNLSPSPLSRLRKLSDVGSSGKSKPSGGIAGALAASGMAGMGVGHAALLQQGQSALTPSKENGARSRNSSIGADYIGGYQGGVYRDPKTGKMVERQPGADDEEEIANRMRYMRDRSATGSTLSLASSDVSAASGLNAAANFSTAAAAQVGLNAGLLGPDDMLRRGNGEAPPLTPGGIGAVGGLSPSGLGERVALGDDEPWPGDMGSQITGFAVASSKRNADFHALFSSVPEDDYLIEDYGCALVREILIQGRLYVSENHVCFYANIFGWITNVSGSGFRLHSKSL